MDTKVCAKCKKDKPLSAFAKDEKRPDGHSNVCKDCAEAGTSQPGTSSTEPGMGNMNGEAGTYGETVDLKNVDVMAADVRVYGGGAAPAGGEAFSSERLERIAADTREVMDELRPPNKIGHNPAQTLAKNSGFSLDDDQPALGWLDNVRAEDGKLRVDVRKVPSKLADLFRSGAFRTRSPEISPYTSQKTGKSYPAVLRGLAWMGADRPAFKTLDDIHALYHDGEPTTPTAELLYEDAQPDAEFAVYSEGDTIWDEGATDRKLEWKVTADEALKTLKLPSLAKSQTDASVSADTTNMPEVHENKTEDAISAEETGVLKALARMFKTSTEADAPEVKLDEAAVKVFAEAAGVPDETDPAKILAAVKATKDAAAVKPEPTVPEGMKLMGESDLHDLQVQASQGVEALKRFNELERDTYFKDLTRQGKLDPADYEHYTKIYSENPNLARLTLDKLPVREEIVATYGAEGEEEIDVSSYSEDQYAAFCAATGTPYFARKTAEQEVK